MYILQIFINFSKKEIYDSLLINWLEVENEIFDFWLFARNDSEGINDRIMIPSNCIAIIYYYILIFQDYSITILWSNKKKKIADPIIGIIIFLEK